MRKKAKEQKSKREITSTRIYADQRSAVKRHTPDWQNIIWREWRYSEDEDYAQHLFNLVADEPIGWWGVVCMALLGTLYGELAGLWLKLLITSYVSPLPFPEASLLLLVWLGGILGGVGVVLLTKGRLSWRTWLGWLTPTPFFGKIGKSDLPDSEWWLGVVIGLSRLGIGSGALVGFLVASLLRRKYEVGSRGGNEYLAGGVVGTLAASLGALVGNLVGQGDGLGAGLGLALGIWSGVVWGSGLIGVLIGWLSIMVGWLIFGESNGLTGWLGLSLGYGIGVTLNGLRHHSEIDKYHPYRSWYFWWHGQPTPAEIKNSLQGAIAARPHFRDIWAEPLHRLKQSEEQLDQPNLLIAGLQKQNWVDRFTTRHALVTLGGEATMTLGEIAADTTGLLRQTVLWLLASIEQDTTNRLAPRLSHLLCPRCVTRFARRVVNLPRGISFIYYGCRMCGQSREFLERVNQVVAVLDKTWSESLLQKDDQLHLNWFQRQAWFDFDRVEILQATDEDVERFALQVGNDTDSFRKPRYKRVTCMIGSACHLSENTLRILRHTFGLVEQREGVTK